MFYDHSSKSIHSFTGEIYSHTAFVCAHSHRLYNNLNQHHSDVETGSHCTWMYTNSIDASTIICNQIQRACEKRKHKEIIEHRLILASLNACTPVCCFEGVIHWRFGKTFFFVLFFIWLILFLWQNESVHSLCKVDVFLLMGFGASYLKIDVCVRHVWERKVYQHWLLNMYSFFCFVTREENGGTLTRQRWIYVWGVRGEQLVRALPPNTKPSLSDLYPLLNLLDLY